jgi:hypothetical protein
VGIHIVPAITSFHPWLKHLLKVYPEDIIEIVREFSYFILLALQSLLICCFFYSTYYLLTLNIIHLYYPTRMKDKGRGFLLVLFIALSLVPIT